MEEMKRLDDMRNIINSEEELDGQMQESNLKELSKLWQKHKESKV